MARETMKAMMEGVAVKGGTKPKLVANNTIRYTRPDGAVVYRLHHTDVVVSLNGVTELYTGGWKTITTKDRINNYSGCQIHSKRGVWYIRILNKTVPFFDGMKIDPDGTVLNSEHSDPDKEAVLLKSIEGFVKKLDDLEQLPVPDAGDCWCCSMFEKAGMKDKEHLHSHIEEGYMHGSLIMNALTWAGYRDPSLIIRMEQRERDQGRKPDMIKRALRRYLRRELGVG